MKTMKSYRLENVSIAMLEELSKKSGYSCTQIIELAVNNLYSMYFDTYGRVTKDSGQDLLYKIESAFVLSRNNFDSVG